MFVVLGGLVCDDVLFTNYSLIHWPAVCRKNVRRRLQLRNVRMKNKRRMRMKLRRMKKRKMKMNRNVLRLLLIQVH